MHCLQLEAERRGGSRCWAQEGAEIPKASMNFVSLQDTGFGMYHCNNVSPLNTTQVILGPHEMGAGTVKDKRL
jgi:hypothetical protein